MTGAQEVGGRGIRAGQATRRLAGPDTADPPKILVVTTFNVDAYVYVYVYVAFRAGASGFLLKDPPPAELVNGVRIVARGDALLAPTVTRTLIGHFAERLRPGDPLRTAREDVVRTLTPRELEVLVRSHLTHRAHRKHHLH